MVLQSNEYDGDKVTDTVLYTVVQSNGYGVTGRGGGSEVCW
jgi:hypothetical protein